MWYKFKLQFCVEIFHKMPQMPQTISVQAQKFGIFEKKLFLGIRSTFVQEMFFIMLSKMIYRLDT